MNKTLRILKFLIYERKLGPRIVGIHVHGLIMTTEYSYIYTDRFLDEHDQMQFPSRAVVHHSHHTPLQWAKLQESCQTEEHVLIISV